MRVKLKVTITHRNLERIDVLFFSRIIPKAHGFIVLLIYMFSVECTFLWMHLILIMDLSHQNGSRNCQRDFPPLSGDSGMFEP